MYTFIDFLKKPQRLEEILNKLKNQGLILRYEVFEKRNQVKIETFSDRAPVVIGIILGQFPEIRDLYLARFNKH